MTTPPLRVRADTRCLKEQRWAYDKGICVQPIGHEKKCRFVWAEGVEVLGGEAAAAAANELGRPDNHRSPDAVTNIA